jgi:UDP-glucose 4-epimerase
VVFQCIWKKGQNPAYSGVLSKFLENVSSGKSPIIYGDGIQAHDFIFIDHVAEVNLLTMNNDLSRKFINIGTGIKTSVMKLPKIIIEISNKDIKPIYVDAKEYDIRNSQTDIILSNELLKWSLKTKIEDWLNTMQNN